MTDAAASSTLSGLAARFRTCSVTGLKVDKNAENSDQSECGDCSGLPALWGRGGRRPGAHALAGGAPASRGHVLPVPDGSRSKHVDLLHHLF